MAINKAHSIAKDATDRKPACSRLIDKQYDTQWIVFCSETCSPVTTKMSPRPAGLPKTLTGKEPLASVSSSVTDIKRSLARGGTIFAGGIVTSS